MSERKQYIFEQTGAALYPLLELAALIGEGPECVGYYGGASTEAFEADGVEPLLPSYYAFKGPNYLATLDFCYHRQRFHTLRVNVMHPMAQDSKMRFALYGIAAQYFIDVEEEYWEEGDEE